MKASANKIADLVASGSKLLEDSITTWTTLQEDPNVQQIQQLVWHKQAELEKVNAELKTLSPAQKMAKVA